MPQTVRGKNIVQFLFKDALLTSRAPGRSEAKPTLDIRPNTGPTGPAHGRGAGRARSQRPVCRAPGWLVSRLLKSRAPPDLVGLDPVMRLTRGTPFPIEGQMLTRPPLLLIVHRPGFSGVTILTPQPQQQLCAAVENFSEYRGCRYPEFCGIRSVKLGRRAISLVMRYRL